MAVFFFTEPLDVRPHDIGARVGQRVYGVPHAVDETRFVKRLFVEQSGEIVAHVRIGRGTQVGLHILEHAYDLDIGAAVPGAFERA